MVDLLLSGGPTEESNVTVSSNDTSTLGLPVTISVTVIRERSQRWSKLAPLTIPVLALCDPRPQKLELERCLDCTPHPIPLCLHLSLTHSHSCSKSISSSSSSRKCFFRLALCPGLLQYRPVTTFMHLHLQCSMLPEDDGGRHAFCYMYIQWSVGYEATCSK